MHGYHTRLTANRPVKAYQETQGKSEMAQQRKSQHSPLGKSKPEGKTHRNGHYNNKKNSSIMIRRQFLTCSSLSFLLISLIALLHEHFCTISISTHLITDLLTYLLLTPLGMAHPKLRASRWACPHLLFPAGRWPSTLPKGWSSSPFCMDCSIFVFWG